MPANGRGFARVRCEAYCSGASSSLAPPRCLFGLRPDQTSGGAGMDDPVGLTVASVWATLRIPSMAISFSISTLSTSGRAAVRAAAGSFAAALDACAFGPHGRASADDRRVLFNMAAVTISLWLAARCFFAIEESYPARRPLARCACSRRFCCSGNDFGLNSGIVAVAVSFERRVSSWIWRENAGVCSRILRDLRRHLVICWDFSARSRPDLNSPLRSFST